MLDQSQASETTPTSAPVLLQAAAAADKSINLDAKDKPEAKKAQLDTLLAKAEQYSQFIVNSQQAEAEPSKKKQKTGLEDAAEKMKKEKALVVQPKAMTGGTLKPYQVEGLRWLATLFENGLSGILADEMGLGKTIQVIALVAHVREKNVKGPICIAAPLATLPNWMNEFRKWTPGISALLYDLGVPSCGGAFTSLIRLVAISRCRGWFLFRYRGRSDRVRREMLRAGTTARSNIEPIYAKRPCARRTRMMMISP